MRLAWLLVGIIGVAAAQELPIRGIAAVSYKVSQLPRTREFYRVMLGFPEPFAAPDPAGNIIMVFLQVNDDQYLEIEPGAAAGASRLTAFALGSSNAPRLRELLKKRGLNPSEVQPRFDGNRQFHITDPDGNTINFVEYMPNSSQSVSRGRFIGAPRVVSHIRYVSLPVRQLQTAAAFYRDRLGLREAGSDGPASVRLQLPGAGQEYLVLRAGAKERAIGFDCDDLQKTTEALTENGELLKRKPEPGPDGPVLRDPDGNRLEFTAAPAEPVH